MNQVMRAVAFGENLKVLVLSKVFDVGINTKYKPNLRYFCLPCYSSFLSLFLNKINGGLLIITSLQFRHRKRQCFETDEKTVMSVVGRKITRVQQSQHQEINSLIFLMYSYCHHWSQSQRCRFSQFQSIKYLLCFLKKTPRKDRSAYRSSKPSPYTFHFKPKIRTYFKLKPNDQLTTKTNFPSNSSRLCRANSVSKCIQSSINRKFSKFTNSLPISQDEGMGNTMRCWGLRPACRGKALLT